jgi:hypothetical protein
MALIREAKVAKRYDVDKRTLKNWDKQPELGFPPPVFINGHRYRDGDKLDKFDAARVKASIMERPKAAKTNLKQFPNQPATEAV